MKGIDDTCKTHPKPVPGSSGNVRPHFIEAFHQGRHQPQGHVLAPKWVAKVALGDHVASHTRTHTHTHIYIYIMHIHTYIYIYIYTYVYTPYIHYITLHYITLHYITLHYITLHYITLHYITLHYITLHYITYILSYIHSVTTNGSWGYYLPIDYSSL